MRIAIVSDCHGNLAGLEAILVDLRRQAPDQVLHGGDLCATGPRPAEVLDLVRAEGWQGVVGNTDELLFRPAVRERVMAAAPGLQPWLRTLFDVLGPWAAERLGRERLDWLAALPRELRAGGGEGLRLVHASPGDLWKAPPPDAADAELAAVFGTEPRLNVYCHIHRPYVRALGPSTAARGGLPQVVANSGSAGLPWDGDPRPSYLLVDGGVATVRRVDYDVLAVGGDACAAGFPYPGWLANLARTARFTRPDA